MKNLAEKQTVFIPNTQLCICLVFSVGVIACVGLLLGALVVVAYLLNFTISIILENVQHIWTLYDHSSAGTQLFTIFIGYCIFQIIYNRFFYTKAERRKDERLK